MTSLKSALIIGNILLINALFLSGCQGWASGSEGVEQTRNQVEQAQNQGDQAESFIADRSTSEIVDQVKMAIIPHHLLVGSFIDKFYQQLATKVKSEKREIKRIILISPNHFGYGYNYIQSSDISEEKKFAVKLDVEGIRALGKVGLLKIEPKYLPNEHGVTAHFSFLKKYFPEAQVMPIILKRTTPRAKLDALIEELVKITTEEDTLIIGSIDFSHYSNEEFALSNDAGMIKWLEESDGCGGLAEEAYRAKLFGDSQALGVSKDVFTEGAVGVDSPESIYVIKSLMSKWGKQKFQLWQRTSSASLIKSLNPKENTSHIFASVS